LLRLSANTKQLLLKLLVVVSLYFITRWIFYFFYIQHFSPFKIKPFIYGFLFDFSAISIIFLPFIAFHLLPSGLRFKKTLEKVLFILGVALSLVLQLVDIGYFKFTLKRTTADIFTYATTGDDFTELLPRFLFDYWYLSVLFFILLYLTIRFYNRINSKIKDYPSHLSFVGFGRSLLQIAFAIVICLFFFRGGFKLKPITIINASEYVRPVNAPLVLNTPFTFIKTLTEENITPVTYFPENELANLYNPVVQLKSNKTFVKRNVVLIILESFSYEYIGSLSGKKTYTPFLDSLVSKSLVYNYTLANGRKSIEALPAILSGIPSLMNTSYIVSNYAGNQIMSLPERLSREGYSTSFYHGGKNGTMGFQAFCKAAGVKEYYGLNEYPNKEDFDGNWGVFDEPFLQYYSSELENKQQPFFSGVFTLTSHHPFEIPKKYKNRFPKGDLKILESIGYADYSLSNFFAEAKTRQFYNNTIFVITADHTSMSNDAYYSGSVGAFRVPFIIFDPQNPSHRVNNKVTQHSDIFPTVLDYLNYNGEIVCFGNSVLRDKESFSINYYNNIYQFYTQHYLLQFDGEKVIALYLYRSDKSLNNNLLDENPDMAAHLEEKIKAIIQQYNNRLINNKLVE
jgi:phosphoglycerol transferase MdoB-like AlkP superfamily enzyme